MINVLSAQKVSRYREKVFANSVRRIAWIVKKENVWSARLPSLMMKERASRTVVIRTSVILKQDNAKSVPKDVPDVHQHPSAQAAIRATCKKDPTASVATSTATPAKTPSV
jgi:hypothetical protein